MISQPQSQINSFSQLAINVLKTIPNAHEHPRTPTHKRQYLQPHEFSQANKYKQTWIRAAIKEGRLRLSEPRVLEILVYLTDPLTGIGCPSIGTILEKHIEKHGPITYRAIQNILNRLEAKGVITIKQRGKKLTNRYELTSYEYKLSACYEDSSDCLNNHIPKDYKSYITYDEYISLCDNLREKQKKPQPKFNPEKHIDPQKMRSDQREIEIRRVCLAWTLSEADIEHIQGVMRTVKSSEPEKVLGGIFKSIKRGTWKRYPLLGLPPEHEEILQAKEYEQAVPDTEEGVKNLTRTLEMLYAFDAIKLTT